MTNTATALLPETGFLRVSQIVGNPKANPPIPAIIPVSRTTWWSGVKEGKYPKPIKLGEATTVWRVEDIRALVASLFDNPPCTEKKPARPNKKRGTA